MNCFIVCFNLLLCIMPLSQCMPLNAGHPSTPDKPSTALNNPPPIRPGPAPSVDNKATGYQTPNQQAHLPRHSHSSHSNTSLAFIENDDGDFTSKLPATFSGPTDSPFSNTKAGNVSTKEAIQDPPVTMCPQIRRLMRIVAADLAARRVNPAPWPWETTTAFYFLTKFEIQALRTPTNYGCSVAIQHNYSRYVPHHVNQ